MYCNELLCANAKYPIALPIVEPGEFKPGSIIEITTRTADRIVVKHYYVSENSERMVEEVAEFSVLNKRNRKNIKSFIDKARKLVKSKYGEEELLIDKDALHYMQKVM